MNKYVLVLGKGFLPHFQKHVLRVNPTLTLIECDYSQDLPEDYSDQYISVSPGNEFKELEDYFSDKDLIAVINRRDYFEKLHGQLVDHFEIPGPSAHAVDQISNKANFHRLMLDLNLNMFRPRAIICQLSEVSQLLKSSQFPVIIKPFAGAHSRGVFKLDSISDFEDVYPQIYSHFKNEKAVGVLDKEDQTVLIEDYLLGRQVTPICYVDKKSKVHFISLVKLVNARDIGEDHYQIIYRVTPSNIKETIQQKMRFVLQKIAKATMLKNTFLDPEFFVYKERVYLIEINVRMGGFRQELAKAAFNINLNKMIAELALSQEVDDQINVIQNGTACEIWDSRSGIIKNIKLPKSKHITWSKLNFQVGDYYSAPPDGNKSLGSFYVTANEKSLKIAKQIRSKIVLEFE